MKAGILFGARDIRVGTVPDAKIRPDEVLVKSAFAGLCGTDLHIYRGEFTARVAYPAVQGHEFGGVVEEVGRDVRGIRRGDRVAVDPIVSCHACVACLAGRINACRTLKLLGVDLGGGFAEYVAAPASHCFVLPDAVSLAHVPMVEVYALGHHILSRGLVQPGETVVILGSGKLGMAVLDVLCHGTSPATTIIADLQPFRLEIARQLGAEHALDIRQVDPVERVLELTHGDGADCVIECVGRTEAWQTAVDLACKGGQILFYGGCPAGSKVQLDTRRIHYDELTILGTFHFTRAEVRTAFDLLVAGEVQVDPLISGKYPLSQLSTAFDRLMGGDGIKFLITPEGVD